jgi:hypothetical protein
MGVLLLVLATGCSRPTSVEHVEVTGKVLYKNKPVTGGRVSFVTVKGAFNSTGTIDEKGNYTIKAPVGDVQISVDNSMLLPRRGGKDKTHILPKPGSESEKHPVKGVYVNLPPKYRTPDTSGLTYTVKSGPQTHDIILPEVTP